MPHAVTALLDCSESAARGGSAAFNNAAGLRGGRRVDEGDVPVRRLRLERRGGRGGRRAEVRRAAALHDGERVGGGPEAKSLRGAWRSPGIVFRQD